MQKRFRSFVSVSLSIAIFMTPVFGSKIIYAAPQLKEMTRRETSTNETNTKPAPKTMKERILEMQNSEMKKNLKVSNIPKGKAYVPEGVELKVEVINELSSKKIKLMKQ